MNIDTILYYQVNNQSKIAMLDNGRLCEYEQFNIDGVAEGNIYLGKISGKTDLANGKVGYFVDINDRVPAFLNADEYGHDNNLTVGQSVVVQVQQEARFEKGAKVVRSVQLVGQNICYCPFKMGVDASSRIGNKALLETYKQQVMEHMTGQEGWILRTSSVDVAIEDIIAEMDDLRQLYNDVRVKARNATAPAVLYSKDNPIFDAIINNEETLQKVVLNNHNIENEIKDVFDGDITTEYDANPFATFGIDDMLEDALASEVKLPSGGRIFIEETKAFVAIDVDSGEDRGNGSISHLNEEAACVIAHQIKLRNLAGKIVIDFAGSSEYKFMKPVLDILHHELAKDKVKTRLFGLTKAGNVEIVRVRRKPSLSAILGNKAQ
jgi:ribonuclease G